MARLETLILAWLVTGPCAVQTALPLLGAGNIMVFQVTPESLDSSILTGPVIPVEVQVMLCGVLCTGQISPPLGDVTVIPWAMLKSASLVSKTPGCDTLEILILACAVAGPLTVQALLPLLLADP